MMRRGKWLAWVLVAAGAMVSNHLAAQNDPGKTPIGHVNVTVYYATDSDPAACGAKASTVAEDTESRLRGEEKLRYKHYRILGNEVQPLLRSYENWAQPLRPSDEVLVRFEARSKPTKEATKLDLELWLSRKKILKTDVRLSGNLPLFILGPEWRGGRLIIGVALAPKEKTGS